PLPIYTSRVTKHLEPSTRWKSCLATPAANSLSTYYATKFPNKLRTFTPLPRQIICRGRGFLLGSKRPLLNHPSFAAPRPARYTQHSRTRRQPAVQSRSLG